MYGIQFHQVGHSNHMPVFVSVCASIHKHGKKNQLYVACNFILVCLYFLIVGHIYSVISSNDFIIGKIKQKHLNAHTHESTH